MSTISNDVLEKLSVRYRLLAKIHDGSESQAWEESALIVEELLALRKERERAEPVAWLVCGSKTFKDRTASTREVAEQAVKDRKDGSTIKPLYTAPPAPSTDDDSLPYDPQIAEYEQMMEAEQAQAGTTSQQFESLAGKAVGRSDGFECTPVADLYELLTKCGECYDYTTSAKVAADWIKEGYSAREYVKLDRLQEAMTQGSSGEADGWIPCSERMPDLKQEVLCVNRWGDFEVAVYDVGYITGEPFFATIDGEFHPTHWQPLPEPQCK
ncbi:DUF551 domain-containing protein [Cronobacter sakazakii]